ncbi:chymotrypsinogen 2-like [Macrobrachium rosenbergii]|uniref:chymotrypsinogen 2-like n=1 Tax=Macrobrachium rosenbergii TaxID=79674 RepID=UPI0034D4DB56
MGTASCQNSPTESPLSLGQSVKIKSPRYPKPYPKNQNCGWHFVSTNPNVRFKVTCPKFRLETGKRKSCYDYLAVDDFFYCGKGFPKLWTSSTNEVVITFKSNVKKNFKGFSCRVRAVSASSIDSTRCLPNPVVNTMPLGTSMVLTSPRYPRNYPRNLECGWYIQVLWVRLSSQIYQQQQSDDHVVFHQQENSQKGFKCKAEAVGPSAYGLGASTNCKCGRVNRGTRIIGGQSTEVNEYPWQVSLVYRNTNESFCGGSIINDRFIVTAAHCTASVSDFQIVVGGHSWANLPPSFRVVEYETYYYNPDYNYFTQDSDLVLIKLATTLDFSNPVIGPICPPRPYNKYYGVNVTVTGWGFSANDSKTIPDELQEVDLTTINNADCQNAYPDYTITSNMLCAWYPAGGKDACQGDSGGPLITQENDYYILVGVVSWGVGCGVAGNPGVYSTVANQMNWINAVASTGETCSK